MRKVAWNFVDLRGCRFGRLVVVGKPKRRNGRLFWPCRCDCGARCAPQSTKLHEGRATSCGCLTRERFARLNLTHGATRDRRPTREYRAWQNLKARCLNPKNAAFRDYGGRGIKVCSRWRDSFPSFLADMGRKPSSAHTLERTNNNGPYSPRNCEWTTRRRQARNRRSTRSVVLAGRRMSLAAACEQLGLKYGTVISRMRRGQTFKQAIRK